jgi:hypothetical protein
LWPITPVRYYRMIWHRPVWLKFESHWTVSNHSILLLGLILRLSCRMRENKKFRTEWQETFSGFNKPLSLHVGFPLYVKCLCMQHVSVWRTFKGYKRISILSRYKLRASGDGTTCFSLYSSTGRLIRVWKTHIFIYDRKQINVNTWSPRIHSSGKHVCHFPLKITYSWLLWSKKLMRYNNSFTIWGSHGGNYEH